MSLLICGGTFTYGHATLSACRVTKFKSTPVYDTAGRTVIASKIDLDVTLYADNSALNPTDLGGEFYRKELTKPGQTLIIENIGIGRLYVNYGGRFDSSWGPKPRVLEFIPHGD